MVRRMGIVVVGLLAALGAALPAADAPKAEPDEAERLQLDLERLRKGDGLAVQEVLRRELAGIVAKMRERLRERNEDRVAVGAFTGPGQIRTSAGPGLQQLVREELQKLGITVGDAKLEVNGVYRLAEEDDPAEGAGAAAPGKRKVARLVARLEESATSKVVLEVERRIYDLGVIAVLFGKSYEVRRPVIRVVRGNLVVEGAEIVEAPRPVGTVVRAAAGSPYGVEILVQQPNKQFVARQPVVNGTDVYVPLRRDEVYAVRLFNDSNHEIAVALSVDGLSTFTFSRLRHQAGPNRGNPLNRRYIVSPGQSTTVDGWEVDDQEVDRFHITEYAKGAWITANASPADVGTITATFAKAWTGIPPSDEPTTLAALPLPRPHLEIDMMEVGTASKTMNSQFQKLESPKPPVTAPTPGSPAGGPSGAPSAPAQPRAPLPDEGPVATGKGERIPSPSKRVTRQVGVVRAAVSIRYSK